MKRLPPKTPPETTSTPLRGVLVPAEAFDGVAEKDTAARREALVERDRVENHSGATTDEEMIALFLRRFDEKHRNSPLTAKAYALDIALFRRTVRKALRDVTLTDFSDYATGSYGPVPQRRQVAAVKSLFSYATKIGYLRFNVGGAVELQKQADTMTERIFSPEQVARLIAHFRDDFDPRRRLFMRFLYGTGARLSGALGVTAGDLRDRDNGRGQVTLTEKGNKERSVLLPPGLWARIRAVIPADAPPETRLFNWKPRRAEEIFKMAARAIGVPGASPHWMRHSHATHAVERGVKMHVLRDTLGHADLSTTGKYLHARPDESSAMSLEDDGSEENDVE